MYNKAFILYMFWNAPTQNMGHMENGKLMWGAQEGAA